MKAIILAAGKATRLLPLTKDTPQCLLKVGERTILERQIESINKGGVKDVDVITGYLGEQVETSTGAKVLFNPFYNVSGMAMTLWVVREELKDGFVFLYSDVLFDPKVIAGLLKDKGDICLAIKKGNLREEAEKVIESEGLIEDITKDKVEGENGEFIGIAKFSEEGAKKLILELDKVAKDNINASFIELIDSLIGNGEEVRAYDIGDSTFIDIDFPEDLTEAEKIFSN